MRQSGDRQVEWFSADNKKLEHYARSKPDFASREGILKLLNDMVEGRSSARLLAEWNTHNLGEFLKLWLAEIEIIHWGSDEWAICEKLIERLEGTICEEADEHLEMLIGYREQQLDACIEKENRD